MTTTIILLIDLALVIGLVSLGVFIKKRSDEHKEENKPEKADMSIFKGSKSQMGDINYPVRAIPHSDVDLMEAMTQIRDNGSDGGLFDSYNNGYNILKNSNRNLNHNYANDLATRSVTPFENGGLNMNNNITQQMMHHQSSMTNHFNI